MRRTRRGQERFTRQSQDIPWTRLEHRFAEHHSSRCQADGITTTNCDKHDRHSQYQGQRAVSPLTGLILSPPSSVRGSISEEEEYTRDKSSLETRGATHGIERGPQESNHFENNETWGWERGLRPSQCSTLGQQVVVLLIKKL